MKDKLTGLIRTTEAFSEKAAQVSPRSLTTFGIPIFSRYGKSSEVIEMLQFAQAAALASVAHYVKKIEYDSKACVCAFELDEAVVQGSEVERTLLEIAKRTISHFHWFDDEHFDDGEA